MSDMLYKFYDLDLHLSIQNILTDNFDRSYQVFYRKSDTSELNALCDKYGTDQGEIKSSGPGHPYPWPSHTYADFIESHFQHCREYVKKVFECGIGSNDPAVPSNMGVRGKPGASLRVWHDYFPNAHIYGADIDLKTLFQEPRISTFYCDQTDASTIARMWSEINTSDFDLMIDDGLHTFAAARCLFENSFDRLKKGGMYIIEDVKALDLVLFAQYFKTRMYNYDFVNLYRKNIPLGDNSLVVIRK
jgi:hypothetical protein